MPAFAHAYTDDPLGLATEATIILTDLKGGPRAQFVEVFAANAAYIAAAAQAIKPSEEWQIDYELLGTDDLVLDIGTAVNTDYIITGVQVSCGPDKYPTVSVTAMKLLASVGGASNIAALLTSFSHTLTVVGGFGAMNRTLLGVSLPADGGVSASLSLSMQTAEAMAETTGALLADGFTMYGMKQECTYEAFSAITPPVAGKVTAEDTRTSRTGWKIFAKSWFEYIGSVPTPP
jgi:hypothetical protein